MQQGDAKLQRFSPSSPIKDGDDDDDDAGLTSVFVFSDYIRNNHVSILQIKLNKDGHPVDDDPKELVRFHVPDEDRPVEWFFSPLTNSTIDLYVLPKFIGHTNKPKHAYKFNFQTLSFQKINSPQTPKYNGKAVHVGGRLFFFEQPREKIYPSTDLECYDPTTDSWTALKPFPDSPSHSRILATAVWGDIILFNVATLYPSGGYLLSVSSYDMWAYDVCRNEWYPVDDRGDERCCSIQGQAVVTESTIYALTNMDSDSLMALSIKRKDRGHAGPKFTCSVLSHIQMQGMTPDFFREEAWFRTRQLVPLGNDNFCLVQSCLPVGKIEYQPIHLSYIKLEEKNSMILTHAHELKMEHGGPFDVLQAFSMPKGMTSALEKCDGSVLHLHLDSFSDTFVSIQEDNGDYVTTDSDTEPAYGG